MRVRMKSGTIEPSMHSDTETGVRLRFHDRPTEELFVEQNDKRNRVFNRVGILLSLAAWVIALLGAAGEYSQQLRFVIAAASLILGPLFVFTVVATYVDRLWRWCQPLSAIANLSAGLLPSYFTVALFYEPIFLGYGIVLIVFFSYFVLRIRFAISVVVTFCYTAAAIASALMRGTGESGQLLIVTTGIFNGWLAGTVGGYFLERSARRNFLQQRLIERQREQISAERERSENLLLNILPPEIAERLKNKEKTIADRFESATVLFADIVQFTNKSSRMTAEQVVARLNDLFSRFDELASEHGVEKIKTIGDAYMVVGGVPRPCDDHADRVVRFAKEMLEAVAAHNKEVEDEIEIRIGVCTGPVVAGVIGRRKFLYDLWGDTVNTASRMESNGVAGSIHLTQSTIDLLGNGAGAHGRSPMEIKGKGVMQTYLIGGLSEHGD